MTTSPIREGFSCSFCGKSQFDIRKLIAGPGVYICNECIDLCNQILTSEFAADAGQTSDTDQPGDTGSGDTGSGDAGSGENPPNPPNPPKSPNLPKPPSPPKSPSPPHSPPTIKAWEGLSDDDLLGEMARTHGAHQNVDRGVAQHVAALRARGVTWARIGEALGMTRQSAWERFSGEA